MARTNLGVHHFPDGISGVKPNTPLAPFTGGLDPNVWCIHMEDFVKFNTTADAGWTFTQTNGTLAVVGPTGVVTITLGGADNDLGQLYHSSGAWQTNSKKLLWECRCNVNSVTLGQEEVAIGLSSVQTGTAFFNSAGTARTMDDFMGFVSYDGNTTMDAIQGEADTFSTETDALTIVDNTYMTLGCYYDGTQTEFYHDRALVATLTTNEPTSVLTPMMYIKAGDAEAQVLSVDYFWVAAER